ncbi:MAG TPA: MraY family glycosyltransferase [Armatimonadota bacterium]|jgi:UDP-GlcNAc:undecaprenyl-phosphate GlcNAc-1-phosphate transferase
MMLTLLLVVGVALVLTVALVPLVRLLMTRLGLVVAPGGRHAHARPTPTAGGIAIYVAVWAAIVAGSMAVGHWPWHNQGLIGMFFGSLLLFVVCLTDDALNLPVFPRLFGQVLVALITWESGVRIVGLSHPIYIHGAGYLQLGWLSAPLTIAWIVLLINAVNWLDGLDGLAAGVMGLAAITFAIMASSSPNVLMWMMAAALAAGCLSFLIYNFNPAKIFMGDTGAMFLGYMIACLSIMGAFKTTTAVAMAAPLLILGVPLYDTVSTLVGRVLRRKSIYSADRSHLHHRLVDRGLSVRQAVLVIYGCTAALCLVALGLWSR